MDVLSEITISVPLAQVMALVILLSLFSISGRQHWCVPMTLLMAAHWVLILNKEHLAGYLGGGESFMAAYAISAICIGIMTFISFFSGRN